MMQLASKWSISFNIQHLAQQQGYLKILWAILRNTAFLRFCLAHTANHRSIPHEDAMTQTMANMAWKQIGSEHWEHRASQDPKRSLRWTRDTKRTVRAPNGEKHRQTIM
jgi:hypothetical protein